MSLEPQRRSTYLTLLPSIYSGEEFMGRFLLAFEQVFSGLDGGEPEPAKGLEQTIAHLAELCTPATPPDFLPWLSSWLALGFAAELDEDTRRAFLASSMRLYKRRGTVPNLAELLKIYTTFAPVITEGDDMPPEVRGRPHHFHVQIHLADPTVIDKWRPVARALIDLQKPAYTTYTLTFEVVTMQLGVTSTIGKDTILGTLTNTK